MIRKSVVPIDNDDNQALMHDNNSRNMEMSCSTEIRTES